MDREAPAFERGPQALQPQEPQPESGFVSSFLKRRRSRQGGEGSLVPNLAPATAEPIKSPKVERPVPGAEAGEAAAAPEAEPTVVNRLRRLGERTLSVVFETRDKLIEPFERTPDVPEVAQLDDAAEDVDDALESLEATNPTPKARSVRVEAPAEMRIEHARADDEPTVQTESLDIDPVGPESSYESGWADGVKAATRRITGEMTQRFERIGHEPKRAVTSAEIGVVAVLLGGALGMLFVSERRSSKAVKREQRSSKKQQEVIIDKLEHQAEVIEQQEHELEQLAHRANTDAPLGEVRKEAREVVTFAHRQADTIREVAREATPEVPEKYATSSRLQKSERMVREQKSSPERPPLIPGAYVEPEKPGLIDRLKPLIGLESVEIGGSSQSRPANRDSQGSVGGGASGGMFAPIATASQKALPGLKHVKQKVDDAASSPFAWVYGLALLAATVGAVAVIWALTR